MKNTIEFLKKDRKVNAAFIKRLEKVGLEVFYGTYSYWDSQEYVQIGREKVWLVETTYHGNSMGINFRYQNEVVKEILNTIKTQKEELERADALVENFFSKLEELM